MTSAARVMFSRWYVSLAGGTGGVEGTTPGSELVGGYKVDTSESEFDGVVFGGGYG
jgi:hypothetical protein